jgi:rare lipoprotein A
MMDVHSASNPDSGTSLPPAAGFNVRGTFADWARIVLLGLPLVTFFACAGRGPAPQSCPSTTSNYLNELKLKPYSVNGVWYYPLPTAVGYRERGVASWYGADFHGHLTASGECYNMHAMTAAHKTLPLGTLVRVTCLENKRSVVVRINDRGPFVDGRIIDLSYGAAKQLGLTDEGIAKVQVETVRLAQAELAGGGTRPELPPPSPPPSIIRGVFVVQVGSFRDPEQALALKDAMAKSYQRVQVSTFTLNGIDYYRVQVGRYDTLDRARLELARLKQTGFPDAFVVARDEN